MRRTTETQHRIVLALVAMAATGSAARASAVVATPYIDTNVVGEVQTGRMGLGASVGYYLHGRAGFEIDVERHPHFFRDERVADLVPDEGVDLDTDATLLMGNVLLPFRVEGAVGIWRPYGTAGLGMIDAVFDALVFDGTASQSAYDSEQRNLAYDVGGGVMHKLTHVVGFRVDVRYFHALVEEGTDKGGYAQDYDFCRVAVGVTLGFPK
jgi:hypothetical protein